MSRKLIVLKSIKLTISAETYRVLKICESLLGTFTDNLKSYLIREM